MDGLIGEIRLFSFKTIPAGWLPCNGQLLQISKNTALYTLLHTTYGGDGKTTFALPNMNGRTIRGSTNDLGQMGGAETVTLTMNNIPQHTHYVYCDSDKGTAASANSGIPAQVAPTSSTVTTPAPMLYQVNGTVVQTPMDPTSIPSVGGGAAHNNMQPYLAIAYCICNSGVYPSRD